jgi:hypothetical protein
MQKYLWKLILGYLNRHKLTREEEIDLLNYFNKEINAFPVDNCVTIQPTGMLLANGRQMTLEQRESFLQGVKALSNNTAFNLIADQVVYQAIKVGKHDATQLDHLYFSKTALYFVDLFKTYLEKLNKLA